MSHRDDNMTTTTLHTERVKGRRLTPEAQRALAEAEERRAAKGREDAAAKELYGRDGPEPVRFGDWEVKGIATDF